MGKSQKSHELVMRNSQDSYYKSMTKLWESIYENVIRMSKESHE